MRTKIIATIGPNSSSRPVLKKLIAAGMDIARINCSHATPPEIFKRVSDIRSAAHSQGRRIQIMIDLQGPRLRVSNISKNGRVLCENEMVVFDTTPTTHRGVLHIEDPYLHQDIRVGHQLFLANGVLELLVTKVFHTSIHARVVRGGLLLNRKGVNVPQTKLTTAGLTPKDMADVKHGLAAGVDLVAMSFVQTAKDIESLRRLTGQRVGIVAKIEMAVALSHLKEIIKASDMIMVARGDLGCEVPPEEVPFLQKKIIKLANRHHRPSIVATQMMISMVNATHPTRAEVSDVANAVLDGANMLMLSDETAAGQFPVAAVATMHRIIRRAEQ